MLPFPRQVMVGFMFLMIGSGALVGCHAQAGLALSVTGTPVPKASPTVDFLKVDYSQPQNVLALFYRLILARRWEDAYSLLTRDSKDATKLGDFVQIMAGQKGRVQLVKVDFIGTGQVSDTEAYFYCVAKWDQVYPKVGKYETYFVRSLIKENGAWRIRWRNPEHQFDLSRVIQVGQAQESHGVDFTLTRVVVLEASTMVFVEFTNRSGRSVEFDVNTARLLLADGEAVPLATLAENRLGLRILTPGEERKDVFIFQALKPGTTQLQFVSPKLKLGNDSWDYSYSVSVGLS